MWSYLNSVNGRSGASKSAYASVVDLKDGSIGDPSEITQTFVEFATTATLRHTIVVAGWKIYLSVQFSRDESNVRHKFYLSSHRKHRIIQF